MAGENKLKYKPDKKQRGLYNNGRLAAVDISPLFDSCIDLGELDDSANRGFYWQKGCKPRVVLAHPKCNVDHIPEAAERFDGRAKCLEVRVKRIGKRGGGVLLFFTPIYEQQPPTP